MEETQFEPCPPCKVIINGGIIAEMAPMIDGEDAANLAKAALAYRNILSVLGIEVSPDDLANFEGCEHGQLLLKWRRSGKPDVDLMRKWTAEILDAIGDLVDGNLPQV